MKVKFWKPHGGLLVTIMLLVISFAFVALWISGIIVSRSYWYIFAILTAVFVALILCIFLSKEYFSTITLSSDEIEWKWYKKKILSIKWEDVSDIQVKSVYIGTYNLIFVLEDKRKIEVALTLKLYCTIMTLCPYQSLKNIIENNSHLRNWKYNEYYEEIMKSEDDKQ